MMLPLNPLLGLLFNRWTAMAALAVAGAGFAAYHGYLWGKVDGELQVAELRSEQQRAMLEFVQENDAARQAAVLRGNALSRDFAQAKADLTEQRVQLLRSVSRVTTTYRPAPNAAPIALPACVFTTGFVRNWNAALGVPTAGTTASGVAAQASTADAVDELAPSSTEQADILNNHIDNASRCQAIESQLNRLIDWHAGIAP